jgi:replication factor C small subunit
MEELWVEKYRPRCIADYVWKDDRQRKQVEQWIATKTIPHLLLSGTQGIGKTSLINVLLNELHIENGDVLELNCSEETSVEVVRTKILNFASTIPFGDFKVIVCEEFEAMSGSAQAALKRIIEEYSESTRFILTTNTPHKIIAPIHSRLQNFHMISLDKDAFRFRLAEVLAAENVDADVATLECYIDAGYPDLRKVLGSMQLNTVDGKLLMPSMDSTSKTDWMVKAVELFKLGQITEAREHLVANADYGDYPEIYRYLYRNLHLWGEAESQREDSIIAIRDGIVKDGQCGDREINLAATLVQLKNIRNGKSS